MIRAGRGLAWVVALLLVGAAGAPGMEATADGEISVQWVVGARRPGEVEPVGVTQDTALEEGSRLALLMVPRESAYVYALRLDDRGRVQKLLPRDIGRAADSRETQRFPEDPVEWFELASGASRETLFLVASSTRLEALESLLRRLEPEPDAESTLGREIAAEAKRLRRLAIQKPSETILIGGVVRAIDPLSSLKKNKTTARGLIVRSITIVHR